jgi:hypothetical protein
VPFDFAGPAAVVGVLGELLLDLQQPGSPLLAATGSAVRATAVRG